MKESIAACWLSTASWLLRREPAHGIGDGQYTVAQRVAEANKDLRRRPGHNGALTQIQLNEAANLLLARQGFCRSSIPATGQTVRLRTNANLATGGPVTEVTDEVHPSNASLVVLAAQIVSPDVAGFDITCYAIRRPLAKQGGAIVEVNAEGILSIFNATLHILGDGDRFDLSERRPMAPMRNLPDVSSLVPSGRANGMNFLLAIDNGSAFAMGTPGDARAKGTVRTQ